MADSSTIPLAEGGRPDSGGISPLFLAAGGIGLLVLLYLFSKGSNGANGPTTAAGTSINAALGSVQEQNLNIMGEVSQAEADLKKQMNADTTQIVGQNSAYSSQIYGAVTAYGSQIYNNNVADYLTLMQQLGYPVPHDALVNAGLAT